jgi:hypothetical protein
VPIDRTQLTRFGKLFRNIFIPITSDLDTSSEIDKADGTNELRFNHSMLLSKRKNSFTMVILLIIVVTLFAVLAPVISRNVPGGGVAGGHIQA